jgi:hypothetical protein
MIRCGIAGRPGIALAACLLSAAPLFAALKKDYHILVEKPVGLTLHNSIPSAPQLELITVIFEMIRDRNAAIGCDAGKEKING